MKKIFYSLLTVLSLSTSVSNAQTWVTIPDPNFVAWLQTNYPSCMNGNQMDISCSDINNESDVDVSNQNISDLEGIQYFYNLENLIAAHNNLTTIHDCSAQYINYSYNNLTDLSGVSLGYLFIVLSNNNITDFPGVLPCMTFSCNNCGLTSLPDFQDVSEIEVSYNNLTSIDTLLPNMFRLICDHNNISSLPALPSTFAVLNCISNNLTSLPLMPESLEELYFDDNQITCVDFFEGPLPSSTIEISHDGNPISCVTNLPINLIDTSLNGTLDQYPQCDASSPCFANSEIIGVVYEDQNHSCSFDLSESTIKNADVKLFAGGLLIQQTTTNQFGEYDFDINTYGTYQVVVDTAGLPFQMLCSNGISHTTILSVTDSTDYNVNFGFECYSTPDLSVNSMARDSGWIFPGQKALIKIIAGDNSQSYNVNCIPSGVSGSLKAIISGPTQYVGTKSGSVAPSIISGDTLIWNIADWSQVNLSSDFHIRILTDISATSSDVIYVEALITSDGPENPTSNNNLSADFNVVNSFDPNIKEVSPDEVYNTNEWITYTIHFQNTGTAPAFNIIVRDTLDNKLDLNTFKLINQSHPVQVHVVDNNLAFSFLNIMLADSTSEEEASHGLVQYKIKMKNNLTPPVQIHNDASIYFDFNTSVVTNDAVIVFNPLSVNAVSKKYLVATYPNPSKDFVNIITNCNSCKLRVLDIQGRIILERNPGADNFTINISDWTSGIYLIEVENENEIQRGKLVKE